MPCNDVTERIQVVLDRDGLLKDYLLTKKTCGQGIGVPELLAPILGGIHIDEILSLDGEGLLRKYKVEQSIEQFLALKHLFALQATLAVYTGHRNGGPEEICRAALITQDEEATTINALISVDLVTEAISACGACRTCASAAR